MARLREKRRGNELGDDASMRGHHDTFSGLDSGGHMWNDESLTMPQRIARSPELCLRQGPSVLRVVRLVFAALVPLVLSSAVAVGLAPAQQGQDLAAPRLNQPGKDVQWVPTPPELVEKMLDLARLTPNDRLVDLGSGDGVVVIAAAKRGARARGIEYDRGLVEFAKRRAADAGVSQLVRFTRGDLFKTDFSEATVVTTFLLPSMNLRLRPTFLALKPGTRIVANTFAIAEWEPDEMVVIDPCDRWCSALLWIVPARVGGAWTTPRGDLVLTQRFQTVSGTLGRTPIEGARLRADAISFTVGDTSYSGRVDGARMFLTAATGGETTNFAAAARLSRP